mmetsp:Transcript_128202/g.304402  ORF Transcript_128202/g.304402 Transcript_128202/m.304402 type:complete len:537 (-) Transcript_128202:158-1768(-)
MYGADAACKVKNTFLEFAPVEEEAALRKRRSRSDGHDLRKSPLVVASKSPNASPLLQAVDETRQAMPIDEVDFEMLEEAAEAEGDSPTHFLQTRKRTSSNGESVAQVAANMGNEPAYVVPTTPSPFLHSSFPPQAQDFNGYGYMPEMGLPPAYDGEGEIDYNEVAMNGGFMQGMAFMSPEMCPENFMQGLFMPYWGQMPMDGQNMMTPEMQQELCRAAEMAAQEEMAPAKAEKAPEEELQQEYRDQVQEHLSQIQELRQEEEAREARKSEEAEKPSRSEPAEKAQERSWDKQGDSKWKDWENWDWHDSSWQDKQNWREHDWRWDDSRKEERRGKGSKSKAETGKEDWASAGREREAKSEPRGETKEKKIPAIPYERPPGDEPYTTVMLRNIPNKYTREMLIKQLSLEFHGEFDFMYLPIDFKNKCNVGYGFINFRTQDACERFIGQFHGVDVRKCLPGLNSKKVVEVTPARVQGLMENVRRLKNSPVMNQLQDHPEWMPLLFDENGVDQPFPLPDQPLPPVKPRGRNRDAPKEGRE